MTWPMRPLTPSHRRSSGDTRWFSPLMARASAVIYRLTAVLSRSRPPFTGRGRRMRTIVFAILSASMAPAGRLWVSGFHVPQPLASIAGGAWNKLREINLIRSPITRCCPLSRISLLFGKGTRRLMVQYHQSLTTSSGSSPIHERKLESTFQ